MSNFVYLGDLKGHTNEILIVEFQQNIILSISKTELFLWHLESFEILRKV
jgi:hypothetical protein